MADAAVLPADAALKRAQQGKSYWRRVWERLRADKVTLAVIGVLVVLLVMVVFAPYFTLHDPYAGSVLRRLKPVGTPDHWLGTDEVGRDLWSRMVYGGRLSLLAGVVPVFLALLIGGFLGVLAGYAGGFVNSAIMRLTDVLYAFPSILLAIAITGILGSGLQNTILALGGSPVTMHLYVDDVDAVHKRAVEAGGKSTRAVENQFYGDRTGSVEDPFGHKWYLATHVEDVSPEEMEKRFAAMMQQSPSC